MHSAHFYTNPPQTLRARFAVRDLLETFVGGDWLTQVNFDTLERVSDSYISDDLRARADSFMAVRVLAHVALLYQDLIRTPRLRYL